MLSFIDSTIDKTKLNFCIIFSGVQNVLVFATFVNFNMFFFLNHNTRYEELIFLTLKI